MRWLTLCLLFIVCGVTACGGDDEPAATPTSAQEPTATEGSADVTAEPTVTTAATATDATEAPPTATPEPPEPSPTDEPGVEFAVIEIAGTHPGDFATVEIEAAPGTECSIAYRTPSDTASAAEGLEPRTAGSDGRIRWEWLIGQSTRPGNGEIVIDCDGTMQTFPIEILEDQSAATPNTSNPGDARITQIEAAVAGDWELVYASLHPEHQAYVEPELFSSCWADAATADITVDVTSVDELAVEVPRIGMQDTAAVTVHYTIGAIELDVTSHLIEVDGTWRWLLPEAALAAYESGNCPSDDTTF